MIDLNKIRELCQRATPPPWTVQDGCSWRRIGATGDGDVLCPTKDRNDGHPDLIAKPEDLAFIAAARTLVPELCDEVERQAKYEMMFEALIETARKMEPHMDEGCANPQVEALLDTIKERNALRTRIASLAAMVRELASLSGHREIGECAVCGGYERHAPDCRLALLLEATGT